MFVDSPASNNGETNHQVQSIAKAPFWGVKWDLFRSAEDFRVVHTGWLIFGGPNSKIVASKIQQNALLGTKGGKVTHSMVAYGSFSTSTLGFEGIASLGGRFSMLIYPGIPIEQNDSFLDSTLGNRRWEKVVVALASWPVQTCRIPNLMFHNRSGTPL